MTKARLNIVEAISLARTKMVDTNKVNMFTEGRALAQLGREPMLYLRWSLFTLIYLTIMSLIHIPYMYFYYVSTDSATNIFQRLSIANWQFQKGGVPNMVLAILELVSCLFTICFLRFMYWYSKRENKRANLLSTADFAVHVRDVPSLEINHGLSRIMHYFSTFGKIVQCAMALDTGDVGRLKEKMEDCSKMISRCNMRLRESFGIISFVRKLYYVARMKLLKREMNVHLAKEAYRCTGDVFIVYNTEIDRYRCLHYFNRPWCQSLFISTPKFVGKYKLRVQEAREPADIIWENLEYGTVSKYTRRTVALFVSLFFMVFVAAIAGVLEFVRNKYYNCKNCGLSSIISTNELKSKTSWVSFGISLLVLVSTYILSFIMYYLVSFEKHRFRSSKRLSLTYKLSLATLFVTLAMNVVYLRFDTNTIGGIPWFTNHHYIPPLVESQTFFYNIFNVIAVAVVINVLKEVFLGPYYWLKRQYEARTSITQDELNDAFTPPTYSYPYRYSNQLKNVLVALAFSAMFPLGMCIVALGLLVCYPIDKYNIIYVYQSRLNDEDLLCDSAINLMSIGYFFRFILIGITNIYYVLSQDSRNVLSYFVLSWIVSTGAFLTYFLLHFAILRGDTFLKKLLCCMSSYRFPEFITPGGSLPCVSFHLPPYKPPVTIDEIRRATRRYKGNELEYVQKKVHKTAVADF